MKRTIALLAALILLLSAIASPVSAAGFSPLWGADSPSPTAEEGAPAAQLELLPLPAGEKEVDPAAAASLNEALNVPGGTLEFETHEADNIYPWVVDGDCAKAANTGKDSTQAQVSTTVQVETDQVISFRYRVSCQEKQDDEFTDWFGFAVGSHVSHPKCGESDWVTYAYHLEPGEYTLTWMYNKDASGSAGDDCAYLDDVALIPYDRYIQYETAHAPELDEALNVPGGTLEFYTPEEMYHGYYPWVVEEDYAKSSNQGIDAMDVDIQSISTVHTVVTTQAGDILRFRYKVSSENSDRLRFYLDGEQLERWSGACDWTIYQRSLEPGQHELKWEYSKDNGSSRLEDTACLDDVHVGAPEPAAEVEIQETASVAGYRKVQLSWNVLPDTAFNREVTFASSDESIATVDENGVVTGVTQGKATITVTTKDGGFTDTCLVTVTGDEMPVNLYGFVKYLSAGFMYGRPAWQGKSHWYTFQDTNPGDAQEIGLMPDSSFVMCAELVDDTVYGYTIDGHFFTMDFEALQRGDVEDEYKEITLYADFYPNEMSYDYSTGKMYIINMLSGLAEVDLETGEIDPDSYREIYGEIPDAPEDLVGSGGDYILGFSIDLGGNAYVMIAGMGEQYGGNGCSRLASLDLETGEYTVIGQTTARAYQEQTMCFDHNSGKLYWAQGCSPYIPDEMNLYIVDTETAELTDCGQIGEQGAGVLGMFVPLCKHDGKIRAVEEKVPTCTEDGYATYYQCLDCGKYFEEEELITETIWEDLLLPATGHKTELRNAKEATCTEDGYTGDEVCTVCGETLKRGEVIPANCPSKAFSDLNTSCWYHEYTDYVLSKGLMNGMENQRFEPDRALTRGMLVTTLYRLAGSPEVTEKATFADLRAGAYYTDAVAWAQDLGIAKGMTETQFAPEKTVSREQAATFLYRFVTLYLEQEPGKGADLSVFKDGNVMNYAKTAMSWAVAEGFFEGYGDGTLRPTTSLTRAQMAKLLTILDQNF